MINLEPEGQGVYHGKLPMTGDKGRMFIIFTVLAVVHTIYTMMCASRCICLYIHLGIPLMYDFIIVYIYICIIYICFIPNSSATMYVNVL